MADTPTASGNNPGKHIEAQYHYNDEKQGNRNRDMDAPGTGPANKFEEKRSYEEIPQ